MRKLLVVVLVVFAAASVADACTATSVIRKAEQHQDSEHYDAIRNVVTETMAGPEGWTHTEATEAATGSIIYDLGKWWYWDTGSGEVDWSKFDTFAEVESAIYREYCWKYQTDHWDQLGAGLGEAESIRDHALMHGNDWETGWDSFNDEQIADWYGDGEPSEPVDNPLDHAG